MKSKSISAEDLIQKKRQALRFFVEELLSSDVRDSIAKIILFGSLGDGKVEEVLKDREDLCTVAQDENAMEEL